MASPTPPKPAKTAVKLRISLMEHTPTIWRRLLVPGGIKLSKLHLIFQVAMGWQNYHLHAFEIAGQRLWRARSPNGRWTTSTRRPCSDDRRRHRADPFLL